MIYSHWLSDTELQTDIAGYRIPELVRRFGTPLCVYDFGAMLDRIASLSSSFDLVRYSPSSNSHLSMLGRLQSEGVGLSVRDAIEVRRGLGAGYSSHRSRNGEKCPNMIFAGNLLERESLDLVVEFGLHVNCGSPDMIDQIGQRRPGADVSLCINPFFGKNYCTTNRSISRDGLSGIGPEQIEDCLFKADQYGIMVTGLQLQLNKGTNEEEFDFACQSLVSAMTLVGRTVTAIGIDGGIFLWNASEKSQQLSVAFHETLNAVRLQVRDLMGHPIQFELSVGEALDSGLRTLISEVRAVKKFGELRCYFVDDEVDDFLSPAGANIARQIAICPRDGATHERPFVDAFLCGPSSPFSRAVGVSELRHERLPIAVVGDFVIVQEMTAETLRVSDYRTNHRTEIALKNGEADVLRKRETYDV